MKTIELAKGRCRTAAVVLLLCAVTLPVFFNGMGLENDVQHFVLLSAYIRHAGAELHSWWLSVLLVAAAVGGFLLFKLVKGILGLGGANAAIIFATAGIMGGAILLDRQAPMLGMSVPQCVIMGPGGFNPHDISVAPPPAPAAGV
ncbi:MAG: hypothetical protein ACAH80_17705 [Alphaproteobacteria bacterium]